VLFLVIVLVVVLVLDSPFRPHAEHALLELIDLLM